MKLWLRDAFLGSLSQSETNTEMDTTSFTSLLCNMFLSYAVCVLLQAACLTQANIHTLISKIQCQEVGLANLSFSSGVSCHVT